MQPEMNRRSFVKETLLSSAGLALALNSRADEPPKPAASPAALPKGKIGKLDVSRLILGGNLLTQGGSGRDQYPHDAQPRASHLAAAPLPQGARRQDSMDHLPHGAG